MTKLPEPDRKPFYFCNKCGFMGDEGPLHTRAGDINQCSYLAACDNRIYTPEQMLQFRRDALEEAANLIVGTYAGITAAMCSNLVRKLKDET